MHCEMHGWNHACIAFCVGGDVAQLVTASDRYVAYVGLIPQCGKGFFSRSQVSVQTVLRVSYTPVCNHMHLHLCVG